MSKLIRTGALALSLALGLAVATACEPTTTGQVTNTVDVKCATTTKAVPTDWYFPVGTPKALVWLQHGFTESKDDWNETGRKAADAGFVVMATTLPTADMFGCTVENAASTASTASSTGSRRSRTPRPTAPTSPASNGASTSRAPRWASVLRCSPSVPQ